MNLSSGCWLLWLALLECCTQFISGINLSQYPPDMADQIGQMEKMLLNLFGHKERPDKIDRSKLVIPEEMIRLYERQSGLKFATSNFDKKAPFLTSANTVRSYLHVESTIDHRFKSPHRIRLKFEPNVPENEVFQHAELSLKRIALINQKSKDPYLRIVVEDIVKPGRKGKHGPIKRVIESKVVDTTKKGSVKLDLTEAVQRWLDNPKDNHGVVINVVTKNTNKLKHLRLRRSLNEDDQTWINLQPVLYTYTDDKREKNDIKAVATQIANRSKRATRSGGRRRKDERSDCMRHKMHVDFTLVGWNDWIVAPPGYDAFYCEGDCPFPLADHLNTTNHAIIQTLMNSMVPMTVPKACCVPTQLNSISMLYVDTYQKVVLKNYKDMVVIGCGCR